MSKPYKLRLTKLAFLSSVDAPAQGEGAQALLLKSDEVRITARVTKMSDELGLVFGHAFAASLDGGATPHVDVQNDAIDPDFLKTAMEFMEAGGATDVNHDFEQDGRIVFAWPLIPEVNDALGIKSDVIGLAVAVKPSAETYKRFKSGELTGFSIAGIGEREPLEKSELGTAIAEVADNFRAEAEAIAMREKAAQSRILVGKDPREVSAAMSAYEGKRTKSTPDRSVRTNTITMTLEDANVEIETLKAKLADAEKRAALTDEERNAEIEKSNPIAFRGEVSGITVRKSEASDFAIKLAKAHEAQAVALAKANEAAEVEKAAKQTEILKARAKSEIGHLPGSDDVKVAVLKAIDGIDGALEMLKGADAFAEAKTEAKGIAAEEPKAAEDPQVALDALVDAEMAAKSVSRARAMDAVTKTAKGAALYTEVQKRIKARK